MTNFSVGAIISSSIDLITQYRHSMLIVSIISETYSIYVSPMFLVKCLKIPSSKSLQFYFLIIKIPDAAISL